VSRKILILFLLALLSFSLSAAIKVSAGNGSWSTGSTWSPSGVPACGDSVIILAAHTVSITMQTDYTACSSLIMAIRGVLYFSSGNKLRLACGTKMYFMPGGRLDSDGSGNSNQLTLCGTAEWVGSQGVINGPRCIPSSLPGCNNVLLPIELSQFTANSCEDRVCLYWQTLREMDNDRFEIERSLNGYEFKTIETIRSKATAGNSTRSLSYETTDETINGVVVYYRLKQVDFDGTETFSDIVAVFHKAEVMQELLVYPNPAKGGFTMQLKGLVSKNEHLSYSVVNTLGTAVLARSDLNSADSGIITISPEERPVPGVYVIAMKAGEHNYTKKLIIQ
jgi:hypothetical protein